jgi:hypothetical protein
MRANPLLPSTRPAKRPCILSSTRSLVHPRTRGPGARTHPSSGIVKGSVTPIISAWALYPNIPGSTATESPGAVFLNMRRVLSSVRSTVVESNASAAGGGSIEMRPLAREFFISRSVGSCTRSNGLIRNQGIPAYPDSFNSARSWSRQFNQEVASFSSHWPPDTHGVVVLQ